MIAKNFELFTTCKSFFLVYNFLTNDLTTLKTPTNNQINRKIQKTLNAQDIWLRREPFKALFKRYIYKKKKTLGQTNLQFFTSLKDYKMSISDYSPFVFILPLPVETVNHVMSTTIVVCQYT